jgi:Mn-containing catalase
MAGLIEEGEEIIKEGKRKEQTAADLALIGAAQRVEHYEMAAYTTARNFFTAKRQAWIEPKDKNHGLACSNVPRPA